MVFLNKNNNILSETFFIGSCTFTDVTINAAFNDPRIIRRFTLPNFQKQYFSKTLFLTQDLPPGFNKLQKGLAVLNIGSDKGYLMLCFERVKNNTEYRDDMNGDNF